MDGDKSPATILEDILRQHRGCLGSLLFTELANAAGLNRAQLLQGFEKAKLKMGVASGIRYIYRPSFNFAAYREFLEGRSFNFYYRQKDLEKLT